MDKDFELLYNALSLGWHLRRIAEMSPDILNSREKKEKFDAWLARHLKTDGTRTITGTERASGNQG